MKLFDTRSEYQNEHLIPSLLNPYTTFADWYQEASKSEPSAPNAMNLCTVDENGFPQCRVVLLKAFEESGLVFFTNMNSPKAKEIAQHPKVSLHFYWKSIHKQVRVLGTATPISKTEAAEYFVTRPLESQISAWISDQSTPVASRQTLLEKLNKFREALPEKLGTPKNWGGFRIKPSAIEFWQGAEHRLHHRVRVDLTKEASLEGRYQGEVLSP